MHLSTVFRETVFKPILFCGNPIEGAEGFKWPQFSAQRVPMIHFFIICLSGLRFIHLGSGGCLGFWVLGSVFVKHSKMPGQKLYQILKVDLGMAVKAEAKNLNYHLKKMKTMMNERQKTTDDKNAQLILRFFQNHIDNSFPKLSPNSIVNYKHSIINNHIQWIK